MEPDMNAGHLRAGCYQIGAERMRGIQTRVPWTGELTRVLLDAGEIVIDPVTSCIINPLTAAGLKPDPRVRAVEWSEAEIGEELRPGGGVLDLKCEPTRTPVHKQYDGGCEPFVSATDCGAGVEDIAQSDLATKTTKSEVR
uniref:Uncharacterized protein n=1 Tax=Cacopsylla melanoneura TaxID=428564 RepID=A0A8D8WIC9_9HEMI